jgi:hypothetical protein
LVPGVHTVTATSRANTKKSDTVTVTVTPLGTVTIVDPPKGVFTGGTVPFQANVTGLPDAAVAWTASAGDIDPQQGVLAAPDAPQTVTVTATSVEPPFMSDSVKVKVSAPTFDGNTSAGPQLLGLAYAFGSTAGADLAKYDFDNSGRVDNGDLVMLFREMGWL